MSDEPVLDVQEKDSGKKIGFKLWKFLVLLLVFAIFAFGGWLAWQRFRSSSPIPKSISNSVNFPLYYPSKLPAGFKLDKNSFSHTSSVVLYSLVFDGNKHLAFSIQTRPSSLDFAQLLHNVNKEFNTDAGQADIVNLGGRTTGSLLTPKSWVIINTVDPIDTLTLEQIIRSLAVVRP